MSPTKLSPEATSTAFLYGFKAAGNVLQREYQINLGGRDQAMPSVQVIAINTTGVYFCGHAIATGDKFPEDIQIDASWKPGEDNWQGFVDVVRALFCDKGEIEELFEIVDTAFPDALTGLPRVKSPREIMASLTVATGPVQSWF